MGRKRKNKNCKLSSVSSTKAISSCVQTINMQNFILQKDKYDFKLETPSFEFDNAVWQFRFEFSRREETVQFDIADWQFRFKCNRREEKVLYHVYLIRLKSEIDEHKIFWTFALQDANGKKYDCEEEVCFFFDTDTVVHLRCLDDSIPIYYQRNTLTFVIELISMKSAKAIKDEVSPTTNTDCEKTLSLDLKKLLMNGKDHDLILKVADKEFPAHRNILIARCPAFEAILNNNTKEKSKVIIDLSDCDPKAVEQFLFYVYSGKVETLNSDNVFGLYFISNKYNMVYLKQECSEFIKKLFSPLTICDIIQLAIDYGDKDLLKSSTEYFQNHASDVLSTLEWISFLKTNAIAANELFIKAAKNWDSSKKLTF